MLLVTVTLVAYHESMNLFPCSDCDSFVFWPVVWFSLLRNVSVFGLHRVWHF